MSTCLERILRIIAVALALGAFSAPALAVKYTGGEYNTLYANIGVKGYDVVSYFTEGKPAQGSDRFTHEFGGVKWQFVSKEHRDLFAANPQKNAPQYGGFCSWGVANNKLFEVDPVSGWTIVDGKLYMNFNADLNSTFAKDAEGFISKPTITGPVSTSKPCGSLPQRRAAVSVAVVAGHFLAGHFLNHEHA